MSLLNYLQLQPVDPQEDGSISELDRYTEDDVIDLSQDIDEATLDEGWNRMMQDMHED